MTREDERLFGRASRLLCTCWRTEKIHEMVSKFIMVFLIKYTHMPKQRCFCLSLPVYLDVAPAQAHASSTGPTGPLTAVTLR